MVGARILAMSVAWVVMPPPVTVAQDRSKYREFQLGMSLVAVAERAGTTPEARVVHQRPDLIQELMWQPTRSRRVAARRLGEEGPVQVFPVIWEMTS
jgi:hypothetical protein